MEKKRAILKIGNSGAVLCDEYGSSTGVTLELMLGAGGVLEFELRSDSAVESAVLPDYPIAELTGGSYYFALDTTCGNSDDPPLLIFSGVTLGRDDNGRSVMQVPLNGYAGDRIVEALKGKDAAELFCELGGFDENGNTVFAWQFKLSIRSRVYFGNGNESGVPEPAYYTAVQVEAAISRKMFFEFSSDGISWHDDLRDDDNYMRAKHGSSGIPSEAFDIPRGADGLPGPQGEQGPQGEPGADGQDFAALPGTVIMYAGNTLPDGYLICNGAEISRETYAALFAAIGETYGAGDGENTFALPDLTDRFPEGGTAAGVVKVPGLPNITGDFYRIYTFTDQKTASGAFSLDYYDTAVAPAANQGNGAGVTLKLDASRSSSVYGKSDTVQPPALTLCFCIKY